MGKPITLVPGAHSATGASLPLARVVWHAPPAAGGVATVRDGNGVVLATITYAGRGRGQEPPALSFNPPIQNTSGSVHAVAPGGFLQVWIQGTSSAGG